MASSDEQFMQARRNPNFHQLELKSLIEALEERKELVTGELGKTYKTIADQWKGWEEVAVRVNSVGLGLTRSVKSVKDKWVTFKSRSKTKALEYNKALKRSGGSTVSRPPLTDLERRALALARLASPSNLRVTDSETTSNNIIESLNAQKESKSGIQLITLPLNPANFSSTNNNNNNKQNIGLSFCSTEKINVSSEPPSKVCKTSSSKDIAETLQDIRDLQQKQLDLQEKMFDSQVTFQQEVVKLLRQKVHLSTAKLQLYASKCGLTLDVQK